LGRHQHNNSQGKKFELNSSTLLPERVMNLRNMEGVWLVDSSNVMQLPQSWYTSILGSSEIVVTMVNSSVAAGGNEATKNGVSMFSFLIHFFLNSACLGKENRTA